MFLPLPVFDEENETLAEILIFKHVFISFNRFLTAEQRVILLNFRGRSTVSHLRNKVMDKDNKENALNQQMCPLNFGISERSQHLDGVC